MKFSIVSTPKQTIHPGNISWKEWSGTLPQLNGNIWKNQWKLIKLKHAFCLVDLICRWNQIPNTWKSHQRKSRFYGNLHLKTELFPKFKCQSHFCVVRKRTLVLLLAFYGRTTRLLDMFFMRTIGWIHSLIFVQCVMFTSNMTCFLTWKERTIIRPF